MRDVSSPLRGLEKQLKPFWDTDDDPHSEGQAAAPSDLVRFELGLTLLERVAPGESAASLWAILSGHEPPDAPLSLSQKVQVGRARQYLLAFRSPDQQAWVARRYASLPERLRLFALTGDGEHLAARRKPVSLCPHRETVYADLLNNPVPIRRQPPRWAQAGVYRFGHQGRYDSVRFSPLHLLPPPAQHPLLADINRPTRAPLVVSFSQLLETARWMDREEAARDLPLDERGNWERRFSRVRLDLWSATGNGYEPSDTLTLDGLFHLAGMVSSGKSTLMDVLSVWAVREGLRVVLLVGDVVGVLNRARLFARLGLPVAPLLGGYNRDRQITRLHAAQQAEVALPAPLPPVAHEGFRWISTACPLDALRQDGKGRPLAISETPCSRLEPVTGDDTEGEGDEAQALAPERERFTCPLYGGCPRHLAQREAVDAPLWVGTPASFVYTRVDRAVGPERVHFAEMAYRRADLVIVDEADQVQMQLDTIFNPSQTLVDGNGDGWLNHLEISVANRLNRGGRTLLTQGPVSAWAQSHRVAQNAVDWLYKWVQRYDDIRAWVNRENSYFTDWILLHQVAEKLAGGTQAQHQQNSHADSPAYERLSDAVDAFINDPLGEAGGDALSGFAGVLLRHRDEAASGAAVAQWVGDNLSPTVTFTDEETLLWSRRLQFALMVTVMQNSVAYLTDHWADVEAPLGLEEAAGGLFHRPPDAYFPLLPEPPMGQVLAFQYIPDSGGKAGKLRFFRCTAVGRALLLRFPDLLAQDNIAGPHTLLLSGTSWAGASPAYHVQAPVGGILKAPPSEVEAICQTRFQLRFFSDESGRQIAVSGKQGDARQAALERIAYQLTATPEGAGGGQSLLDRLLSLVEQPERRRALFLVGSYAEAKNTHHYLTTTPGLLKPDDVCFLEADDDTFNAGYRGGSLRRGVVHRFAQTGAKVLIAPLLAVERGHNILTEDGRYAALGAAFFLVRPHPPKDDLGFAIHAINRWGMEHWGEPNYLRRCLAQGQGEEGLGRAARQFRRNAFRKWRHLLYLPLIYSTLPPAERTAMTWSQLVTLWQVVGRLVRGGCAAHVYFCDAAFRQQTPTSSDSDEGGSPAFAAPSLLAEMKRVLSDALREGQTPTGESSQEVALARTLYQPLFNALREMGGL